MLITIYAAFDLCLAVQISLSNFIVLYVYAKSRHVRTPTNAYICSLAVTDFLAGALGIPATVFSVMTRNPSGFLPCLGVHLILCILCTVSTFHLLAMAIDKYVTICCRGCNNSFIDHQQSARHTRARFLIGLAWTMGIGIASLPLVDAFGFASKMRSKYKGECHFLMVVDYSYLVHVIFFGTILFPSLVIAICYASIYARIRSEERAIKCLLRAEERQRRIKNRRKLIRILMILVLAYIICWWPLYIINCVDFFISRSQFQFSPAVTLAAVVLSHVNCAINPLIYAYGMPGFKQSLRRFIVFKLAGRISGNGRPLPTTNPVNFIVGTSDASPMRSPTRRDSSDFRSNYSVSMIANGGAGSQTPSAKGSATAMSNGMLDVNFARRLRRPSSDQLSVHQTNEAAAVKVKATNTCSAGILRRKLLPSFRCADPLPSAQLNNKNNDATHSSRHQQRQRHQRAPPRRKISLVLLKKGWRQRLFEPSLESTSATMDSEIVAAAMAAASRKRSTHERTSRGIEGEEASTVAAERSLLFHTPNDGGGGGGGGDRRGSAKSIRKPSTSSCLV